MGMFVAGRPVCAGVPFQFRDPPKPVCKAQSWLSFTEISTFKPYLLLLSLSDGHVIVFNPVDGMDPSGGGWSMPVDRLENKILAAIQPW